MSYKLVAINKESVIVISTTYNSEMIINLPPLKYSTGRIKKNDKTEEYIYTIPIDYSKQLKSILHDNLIEATTEEINTLDRFIEQKLLIFIDADEK